MCTIRKYAVRAILFIGIIISVVSCNNKVTKTDVRPNILIAIADDASYPFMSAYGEDWLKTPSFDEVARNGIMFTNCYTPNAKCAPSRSCFLTGRNSWQLGAAANHWCYFPPEIKVYTEVLAEHGYYTGHTAKGWAPGVAVDRNGNPRLMTGRAYNSVKLEPPTEFINNTDYAGNFEAFLDSLPAGTPFCFWYGSTEPHRFYEYGSGIDKGNKSLNDIKNIPPVWPSVDSVKTDMLDYAFEMEWFDKHLGKMLRLLDERHLLENTLVIVTADNGMPFPHVKGQVYEHSNHLPLAMMWKDGIRNPGRTCADFVNFIDFAPTFLELAGVNPETSGMLPIQGHSLTGIFNSRADGTTDSDRNFVLVGKERHDVGRPGDVGYPVRGLISNGYLYLHNLKPDRWPAGNPETGYLNVDGGATKTVIINDRRNHGKSRYWDINLGKRPDEELYDIIKDPWCSVNLALVDSLKVKKDSMREVMETKLREQDDPRMFGKGDVFDQYPYADTKDTGFYGRYMSGEKLPAGWVYPSDFEKEKSD